jgi:hypothetical protein
MLPVFGMIDQQRVGSSLVPSIFRMRHLHLRITGASFSFRGNSVPIGVPAWLNLLGPLQGRVLSNCVLSSGVSAYPCPLH